MAKVKLAPVFEGLSNLKASLRFLNLYENDKYRSLEVINIKKRNVENVLSFLKGIGGVVDRINVTGDITVLVELPPEESLGIHIKRSITLFFETLYYEPNTVSLTVTGNCTHKELIAFINRLPAENADGNKTIDVSYYYMSAKNGLSTREVPMTVSDLKEIYLELYPDIDIKKLVDVYDAASEPVLMLYGEPGVGKTTFVRYLIAQGNYSEVAYVKDPAVMQDGELWAMLTQNKYDLIVFDDLDIDLIPRHKNTEATFMTQLLSYSDGIFTNGKTKILVTTNQEVKEIDPALIRPGRCFDFIRLNHLSREDALSFWVNHLHLDEKVFNLTFTSPNITQAQLMSEAHKITNSLVGRSYVKRGNSSYTIQQKLAELGIQAGEGQGSVFQKK